MDLSPENFPNGLSCYCAKFDGSGNMSPWVKLKSTIENFAPLTSMFQKFGFLAQNSSTGHKS